MNISKKSHLLFLFSLLGFLVTDAFASDLYLDGPLNGYYITTGSIYTGYTTTVETGQTARLVACEDIILGDGFNAKEGSTFIAAAGENTDIDDDGMSDCWEATYFDNSLEQEPGWDYDGDKLTNLQEFQLGFDPTEYCLDNDTDTLPDWWELSYFPTLSWGPTDNPPDGDDLLNFQEYKFGLDPTSKDKDPRAELYANDGAIGDEFGHSVLFLT